MAQKEMPVEIPVAWEIIPDRKPGRFMLRLRHKPLAAIQADGHLRGGTTVLLAFSTNVALDLAGDLTGQTAPPPAGRFDA